MGLTFEKLLIIMVIAVFVIGPDRLPMYAQKFAQLVRSIRQLASGAKERMRDEMGPEFDEVDWRKLDPRQYDPRRIIRDALMEENSPEARRARAAQASAERQARRNNGASSAMNAATAANASGAAGAASASATAAGTPSASSKRSASGSSTMLFDDEAT